MKIELTEQELSIIMQALSDVSYRISAPVIQSISKQVQEGLTANKTKETINE